MPYHGNMHQIDWRGSVDSLSQARIEAIRACTGPAALGPIAEAGFQAMESEIGEPPTQDALSTWKYKHDIGQIVRELVPGERRRYDVGMRCQLRVKEETWENVQILTVRLRCDMSTVLGLALERGAQLVDADWAARIPAYRQFRDARAAMPELGMSDVCRALDPPARMSAPRPTSQARHHRAAILS